MNNYTKSKIESINNMRSYEFVSRCITSSTKSITTDDFFNKWISDEMEDSTYSSAMGLFDAILNKKDDVNYEELYFRNTIKIKIINKVINDCTSDTMSGLAFMNVWLRDIISENVSMEDNLKYKLMNGVGDI